MKIYYRMLLTYIMLLVILILLMNYFLIEQIKYFTCNYYLQKKYCHKFGDNAYFAILL